MSAESPGMPGITTTTMSPFEKLLVDLVAADVRYVTVGGIACVFNGHVRTTQDVDILVSADTGNLEKLLNALAVFGEGHARELSPADFPVEAGAVRVVEEFPLDIFTLMAGLRYEDLTPHVRHWEGGSAPVPYLDAAGLIRLKRDSVRERDRLDVIALGQIQQLVEEES